MPNPDKPFSIGVSNRRTLKVGDLTVVAIRPGQVQVGATFYTSAEARQLASETPPGPTATQMVQVLNEQADWADGQDM